MHDLIAMLRGIAHWVCARPIYLSEYASPARARMLKPILEVLAGVPTVVYGYFALTFMTPSAARRVFGQDNVADLQHRFGRPGDGHPDPAAGRAR